MWIYPLWIIEPVGLAADHGEEVIVVQDLEALWSVRLKSAVPGAAGYSQFEAAGVVVLETNRLFGGDSSYYYTGSYVGKNGRLTARVEVKHYAGPANSILVGGPLAGR